MANLDDDQRLSFAILAVCDALEEQDDTRAKESLNKARKHAHAVINRTKRMESITPAEPEEGQDHSE